MTRKGLFANYGQSGEKRTPERIVHRARGEICIAVVVDARRRVRLTRDETAGRLMGETSKGLS